MLLSGVCQSLLKLILEGREVQEMEEDKNKKPKFLNPWNTLREALDNNKRDDPIRLQQKMSNRGYLVNYDPNIIYDNDDDMII